MATPTLPIPDKMKADPDEAARRARQSKVAYVRQALAEPIEADNRFAADTEKHLSGNH